MHGWKCVQEAAIARSNSPQPGLHSHRRAMEASDLHFDGAPEVTCHLHHKPRLRTSWSPNDLLRQHGTPTARSNLAWLRSTTVEVHSCEKPLLPVGRCTYLPELLSCCTRHQQSLHAPRVLDSHFSGIAYQADGCIKAAGGCRRTCTRQSYLLR